MDTRRLCSTPLQMFPEIIFVLIQKRSSHSYEIEFGKTDLCRKIFKYIWKKICFMVFSQIKENHEFKPNNNILMKAVLSLGFDSSEVKMLNFVSLKRFFISLNKLFALPMSWLLYELSYEHISNTVLKSLHLSKWKGIILKKFTKASI